MIYLTCIILGHPKRAKDNRSQHKRSNQKGRNARLYTPDVEEPQATMDDEEVQQGYPIWSKDPERISAYRNLEEIEIPNRHPSLPRLYKYVSSEEHPLRHLYDLPSPKATYVYMYDPTPEGYRLACKLGSVHNIPRGPTCLMSSLGKHAPHNKQNNINLTLM